MDNDHRWMTTLSVLLGTMSLGLCASMPMVALPTLMEAFAVAQTEVQWLITGFKITTTTSILATAWLTTRFGLRRTYVWTLLLFIVFSIMGALSINAEMAIFAHGVQGIAMGLIPALALIAIARVFPAHALGLAMGVFGVGAALASAVGPYLAGRLLEPFGWQVIFVLPLLLCLPALPLALKYVPGVEPDAQRKRFDWLGMALLTVFIVALLNISGFGFTLGWGHWQTLVCLGVTLLALALFVFWQWRNPEPLLELALFRSAPFRAVLGVAVLYGFCLYGGSYLIPYFLQSQAGYSAEASGAMQLPGGVVLIAMIFLAGAMCDRLGARAVLRAGIVVFALAHLCFALISVHTAMWVVVGWFALERMGIGILIPSTNVTAIQSVSPALLPYASTTVNFFSGLSGAIGVNTFSILYQWRLDRAIAQMESPLDSQNTALAFDAFHYCFWLATALLLAALVVAVRVRRCDHDSAPSIVAEAVRA